MTSPKRRHNWYFWSFWIDFEYFELIFLKFYYVIIKL